MRKLLLSWVLLLALAAPAASFAVARSANDGTLAVRDATGKVRIAGTGGFIGRVERGKVTIVDPVDGDGTGPIVSGCEFHRTLFDPDTGGTTAVCNGTKLRFRLVGGRFKVIISGTGINLSAVGHGLVMLNGFGGNDGAFSFNGDDFKSMPDVAQTFQMAAPSAGP